MSTLSLADTRNAFHIGAAHHPYRTLFWVMSALVMAALLVGYLAYEQKTDTSSLSRLHAFESMYMDKCDPQAFDSDAQIAALRQKLYLGSPRLEQTIKTQLPALQGGATCESVEHALRDVDFPMRTVAP